MISLSFISFGAQAQEASSLNNITGTWNDVQNEIQALETMVEELEQFIVSTKNCGDQTPPKHFNGTSCIAINEIDPNIEKHGKTPLSGTICSAQNEAQYFDGSTWGCKVFN